MEFQSHTYLMVNLICVRLQSQCYIINLIQHLCLPIKSRHRTIGGHSQNLNEAPKRVQFSNLLTQKENSKVLSFLVCYFIPLALIV